MKIEIITTLNERLNETGFGTIKSCEDVLKSLQKNYSDVNLNICINKYDLEVIVKRNPDLVVLAVKYILLENNKKIWLSDFFEVANITYTGSNKTTLKFDSNKVMAKEQIRASGINTANYFTAVPNQYLKEKQLPIPYLLFLKPIDSANGNGIDAHSLVTNFKSFKDKVWTLYDKYKQPVLVEKYLAGREFTVAILENPSSNTLMVAAIEIIPPMGSNKARILMGEIKKENTEKLSGISDLSIKAAIIQIAIDSFYALSIKGFGRIDIKMDEQGQCYFIEANLVPGMTKDSSYFPKAFEITNGVDYDTILHLIIEKALERNKGVNVVEISNLEDNLVHH